METTGKTNSPSEKPIEIPEEQIRFLYRFADDLLAVNWDQTARFRSNLDIMANLIPDINAFIDRSIRIVTYDPNNLRAIIGLSGGLDSVVTTELTAKTMERALQNQTAAVVNLVLITFRGQSYEDVVQARKYAEATSSRYPTVAIDYKELDLTDHLRQTDKITNRLIDFLGKTKLYTGDITTTLIDLLTNDAAQKLGFCSMDSTNRTEIILGEINIGAGCQCAPIIPFYKSQVYDMAEVLAIPGFVLDRAPINSSFGNDKVASYFAETPPGLTPRQAYQVLDPVLYHLYDLKLAPEVVTKLLGHPLPFIQRLAQKITLQNHRRNIPCFELSDISIPKPIIEKVFKESFLSA